MDSLIDAINGISDKIGEVFTGFDWFQLIRQILFFSIPAVISCWALKTAREANSISKKANSISLDAKQYELRLLKQNRFDQIMNEFRSDKMYNSLKKLHDGYDKAIEKLEKLGIDAKANEYLIFKEMLNSEETNKSRRYVTQFFGMFAKYYLSERLDKKDVKSL